MEDFELRVERFREEVLRLQNEYGVKLTVDRIDASDDVDTLLVEDKKTGEKDYF